MMFRLIALVALALISTTAIPAIWVITYPQSTVEMDQRMEYPISLLELALSKTGVRYEIRPSSTPLRQARALKRLEENLEINLVWTMTDTQREQDLLPIRIPINKGLIGWRLFLVNERSEFYGKKNLEL